MFNEMVEAATAWASLYWLKILSAILVLIIGLWVTRGLRNLSVRLLDRTKADSTLKKFVGNLVYIFLLAVVIVVTLGQLGVQTTSIIAVLGAAGLAIALALKDTLANFAAGVMILGFKQFKSGDYVEAGGTAGIVEEVKLFTTQLKTPDNKTVFVPNGNIVTNTITNYSMKEMRKIDMTIGIGYGDDIKKAKEVLIAILKEDERVLEEPPLQVVVKELGDSSVNFAVRPWVKTSDYWDLYFDLVETIKLRFDEEGISIPFPQRDVHLFQAAQEN